MIFLKEDVEVSIRCGPFVSPTDGYTAVTGATPTVYLSKNHGAFAARNGSTWTHDRDGWYTCQLTTTDTSTPGPLVLEVVGAATYLPVFMEFMVVHANVFDSLFGAAGADLLDVNAQQLGGTNQTGRDIGASVLLSAGTGAGQISLSSGAVTVGTNNDKTGYTASTVSDKTGYSLADATSDAVIADAVWNAATATYGTTGTYGEKVEAVPTASAIADAVLDEPLTEPSSGTFAWASATLRTVVSWIGALSRNKITQTTSTQTLRNDADNADISTSSVSDVAGTTTRGEWT